MKASGRMVARLYLFPNFMFKKTILALVCLLFTLGGSAAQLTAILQSGDKVTPFYGNNAFVEAYKAAVNGDVITLSPGAFNATNIEKSITVVGTYAFSEDLSKATQFSSSITVSEDDVTLEGIRFTNSTDGKGLIIQGADNLTIDRCYIALLNDQEKTDHKYHNNTILTDCYIIFFYAMSLSQNAVLQNCSVNRFQDMNEIGNPALIENCNVTWFAYYTSSLDATYKRPYAIYRNCYLGLYKTSSSTNTPSLSFSAPSEFHNNCFSENYQYFTYGTDYTKTWSIGYSSAVNSGNITTSRYGNNNSPADGSFSPYPYSSVSYGPVNHKSYPATPFITSSEIDTKTDADGNLHVKITAKAND